MRLIDGDKLLETYKKWIPQLSSKEDEGDRRGVETCIVILEDMQTIELVRCRDCKYSSYDEIFGNRWCNFSSGCRKVKDDDFCSYGERKEGADNDT